MAPHKSTADFTSGPRSPPLCWGDAPGSRRLRGRGQTLLSSDSRPLVRGLLPRPLPRLPLARAPSLPALEEGEGREAMGSGPTDCPAVGLWPRLWSSTAGDGQPFPILPGLSAEQLDGWRWPGPGPEWPSWPAGRRDSAAQSSLTALQLPGQARLWARPERPCSPAQLSWPRFPSRGTRKQNIAPLACGVGAGPLPSQGWTFWRPCGLKSPRVPTAQRRAGTAASPRQHLLPVPAVGVMGADSAPRLHQP